jgi:hypothetical protein
MKLRINCHTCDARKINESNYLDYEQIRIYAQELLVDDRSKEILNRLPFSIKAEEVRSKDLSEEPGIKALNVKGVYEITPEQVVPQGTALTVTGLCKLSPDTEEVLRRYSCLIVNGVILCPKSIAVLLPLPGVTVNGMIKSYPDDYILMENRYGLDKFFPLRAPENTGYFAAFYIYDADSETDFDELIRKNIKFSTEKAYIRKSHLQKAISLFNIEASIVEIPDNCTVIASEQNEIDEQFVNNYGTDLYIIGDVHISGANKNALNRITSLVVEGEITTQEQCVQRLNEIGARYRKITVAKGIVMEDMAIASLDRATLEKADPGILVRDCALLKIDKNVPAELIREKLTVRDCAKISCSYEQKAAVSSVSRDVAFIGSGGIRSMLGTIFGSDTPTLEYQQEPSMYIEDSKSINAEYYEL